jgi:hypothetical protein
MGFIATPPKTLKPKSPGDREFPMRDRLVTLGRLTRLG